MSWPNEMTVSGYAKYVSIAHALLTRGEVIQDGWRADLKSPRRIVVRAIEGKIEVKSSGALVVGKGSLGLVSDHQVSLLPDAVPMLWDLLSEGYCKCGPIGIRAKESRPTLVIDNAGDHARIRCVDTVLELDYPGGIDPDVNEVRVYADRMTIDKSGVDIHVKFS